jgi:asparagine synthase (glutamine-hydrolysing)
MQYLDTKTYLPEDILAKVDRASMLCSLEARVPLLDHRVLEFAARIPSELKFRDGQGKHIFRRLMEELLPKELLTRPKAGFGVPLVQWFNQDLAAYTRDILFATRSLDRGIFRREGIEQMLSEHGKGLADRSHDIWRLLFFEHWCRHYLDEPGTAIETVNPVPAGTSVRRG